MSNSGSNIVRVTVCTKCGACADDVPHIKYCGDGSDKDNPHDWQLPLSEQLKDAAEYALIGGGNGRHWKGIQEICRRFLATTDPSPITQTDRALQAEIDMLRSTFRDTMDRAAMADTYEAWLLEIGRVCGCQHLDEQLPNCVIQYMQGDREEPDAPITVEALKRMGFTNQSPRMLGGRVSDDHWWFFVTDQYKKHLTIEVQLPRAGKHKEVYWWIDDIRRNDDPTIKDVKSLLSALGVKM